VAIRKDPGGHVAAALEVIGAVHGVDLKGRSPLAASAVPKIPGGGEGAILKILGRPVGIGIREGTEAPVATMTHEFGHYVDHALLGGRSALLKRRDWAKDPTLAGWRAAVEASPSYRQLVAARDELAKHARGGLSGEIHGRAEYLLEMEEVFARSYTQYIGTRSGHPEILAHTEGARADSPDERLLPAHWLRAEFAPIARAFDELFAAKGWRKAP
jgi:hypothetical protein